MAATAAVQTSFMKVSESESPKHDRRASVETRRDDVANGRRLARAGERGGRGPAGARLRNSLGARYPARAASFSSVASHPWLAHPRLRRGYPAPRSGDALGRRSLPTPAAWACSLFPLPSPSASLCHS